MSKDIQELKICCLSVPLNEKGIIEHEIDLSLEPDDLFELNFNWKQYDELDPVFWEWNDKFDLLIDIFEDETLPPEKTREAMEILERHMRERKDEPKFIEAAEILKTAPLKAIELNMPLYLDF